MAFSKRKLKVALDTLISQPNRTNEHNSFKFFAKRPSAIIYLPTASARHQPQPVPSVVILQTYSYHIIYPAIVMAVESKHSDFPLLQGIEDYPRWARHAEAELQSQACHDAIYPSAAPLTKNDAVLHLRTLGYVDAEMTADMTFLWIEKKMAKRRKRGTKAIGILKNLVGEKNKQLVEGKSAPEIWKALKDKYQDVSSMSQMEVIRKASLIRMSDFASASLYCNAFETALDRVSGMLQPDSIINRKGAEGILQAFMLANVTDTYKPLIAQLREGWTSKNTDLSKACLSIERYDFAVNDQAVINATSGKALHTKGPNRLAAPKGTCDFEDCVKSGVTTHWKDKCWRKYPDLRPKFSLNRMKTKNAGSKSSSGNVDEAKSEASSAAAAPAAALPTVTS